MKKRNDMILICVCLFLALASLAAVLFLKKDGQFAAVCVDGKEIARYSLSEDRTEKIETEYGYNILVISDGCADITEADCKNQICVHTHKIKSGGETITCLPHHLTVTVIGDDSVDLME